MKIAEVLTLLMKEEALTEGDVSRLSGLSQPTIHRIKSGKVVDPRGAAIMSLAGVFGVTPAQIRGEVPLPDSCSGNPPTAKKMLLSEQEKAECAQLKNVWLDRKKELGLTQEEAAARLNMTQGGLGHYLNGRNSIGLKAKINIASLLEMPPEDIWPECEVVRQYSEAVGNAPEQAEYPNTKVLTAYKIRLDNLRSLLQDRFGGNKRQLAIFVDVSVNTISRIFTGEGANRRNVGDALARKIEDSFNLPSGWLDQPHRGMRRTDSDQETIELPCPTEQELLKYARADIKPSQFASVYETAWLSTPTAWAFQVKNRANEPVLFKGDYVAIVPTQDVLDGELGLYAIGNTLVLAQKTSIGLEFCGLNPVVPEGLPIPIGYVHSKLPIKLTER